MKKYLHIVISVVVTAAFLYVVFRDQSLESFVDIIQSVKVSYLTLYILLAITGVIARAARYRIVFSVDKNQTHVPTRSQTLVITMVRNALVDTLPARLGELGFFYIARRYGVSLATSATAFGLCLALDLVVLGYIVVLAALAAPLMQTGLSVSNSGGIVIGLVLSLCVVSFILYQMDRIMIWATRFIPKLKGDSRLARLVRSFTEFAITLGSQAVTLKQERQFLPLLLTTFVLRLAKYGGLYVLLVAIVSQWNLGFSDLNPLLSFAAFISAEASASLPISGIMGFGAYETAWSAIFSLSNVEIPSEKSVILAHHLITQIVGYSLGLMGLLWFFVSEVFRKSE